MRSSRISRSLAITLLVGACSGQSMLERFTPADADARARHYIGQLARGEVDSVSARLAAPLRSRETESELRKMAGFLPDQPFDTVRVIGAVTNTVNGIRHVNLSYELHSPASWFVANVATVDTAGTWFVEGLHAESLAEPLEVANAFSLGGKSPRHYLWLVLTVVCALFSTGTALFIASRRGMPGRWRWVFISLIGVVAFRLNWSTGDFDVGLLRVQLASAGVVRMGPVAPWILSFAIPVGALLALARYWRWRRAATSTPVIPLEPQAT